MDAMQYCSGHFLVILPFRSHSGEWSHKIIFIFFRDILGQPQNSTYFLYCTMIQPTAAPCYYYQPTHVSSTRAIFRHMLSNPSARQAVQASMANHPPPFPPMFSSIQDPRERQLAILGEALRIIDGERDNPNGGERDHDGNTPTQQ